jgi:hypothetical protein
VKRKWFVVALTLSLFFGAVSCTTLSRTEKSMLRELESYGVREHEITKHPLAAGALNILPGFGNFYLAIGTEESGHWLYGLLNLLTWPLSVLWGVPEAAIDAIAINKRETVYYYTYDPNGKKEFERLKAQAR